MTRRYFVPNLPQAGGLVALPAEEAQHATRVMRIQVGDVITLFDGEGRESESSVVSLGRNECQCNSGPAELVDREPACSVHLAVALPKPDRSRELIERLTELGVASVTPIVAERTQRGPSESLIEKLRRGVIEACKQSGRNQLLEIRPTMSAKDFFNSSGSSLRLIAHPMESMVSMASAKAEESVVVAIGPEGGWTEGEVSLAIESGFQGVDLGRRIYRIETAAVVVASVLVS